MSTLNIFFMDSWRKLSHNYHQIFLLNNSSGNIRNHLQGQFSTTIIIRPIDSLADWLQSPVTKYFFLIILFDNPLK